MNDLKEQHPTHPPAWITSWPDISCNDHARRMEACEMYNIDWVIDLTAGQSPASKAFLSEVPRDVLEMVERFPCCRIPLLAYAAQNEKKFVRLGFQSPALLFTLAYRSWTSDQSIRISDKKQRELWEALGYPASRSFARQMARLPLSRIRPNTVPMLSARWRNSATFRKLFRHAPHMNEQAVDCLIALHDRYLQPWILRVASGCIAAPFVIGRCVQLLYANWRLVHPDKEPDFAHIKDLTSMRRVLARLEFDLQSRDFFFDEEFQNAFPPPPVQGTDTITPISHPIQLRKEAERQANCLTHYVVSIYAGKNYAYRCPSRGLSILLEKDETGEWHLAAVERGQNTPASANDLRLVKVWLKEKGIS